MVLKATRWEIEAAVLLSEVAYSVQPHLDNDPVKRFRSKFSVVGGDQLFCCTASGQKYVSALVQRGDSTTLVCAFAGTHLPGDWERVNIRLNHATDAREVGAPGHTGFLQRALDVQIEGIERIARDGGASRVVLCGHSLGGAVAHFCLLRWLFGRRSEKFGKDNVVSIAVGSPFFGGQDMLDHVLRHGWSDCFINLVNGNDPVPRVMNLAATLVDSTISCSLDMLLSTCVAFLKKVNPTVGLAQNLVEAIKQSPQEDLVEWASYLPIGHYVVFPAEEKGTVLVTDNNTDYVTELLGPVHLLGEKPSFVNGFLDHSSLAHHEVSAYHNILEANHDEIGSLCAKEKTSIPFQSAFRLGCNADVLSATDLVPIVHEISCETFTSHEKQHCRIVKVSGRNLDFVGCSSIDLDVDKADTTWSEECVVESQVIRRSTSDLVIEQNLRLNAPPRPLVDVQCQFRSDVVVDGSGVSTTDHTLYRTSCHSAESTPRNQHCCLYGGQFFLDSLQHAWITKKLFNDATLERKMEELAMLVQFLGCAKSESPDFLQLNPDWSSLEEVGRSESHTQSRETLFKWLVPPDGLIVRTKLETRSSMAAIFLSIAVGGGIIATGGLGIVGGLLGYGASLSGGYGTASVLASGGTLSYFLLRSRLRSEYCVLLEDLIKIYTGSIPKTRSEVELEDVLLHSHDEYQSTQEKGNVRKMSKTRGIPCFDQYDEESQKKFEERVKVIRYIHEIKEARGQAAFIVVCGPRDSGKTTLVSQLLQEPRLAATASGYRGGEEETTTVIPHQLADVPGTAILDSPGLTGVDVGTRDMFERCAMRLTTTFVYVRAYEGLPTEVDLQTVARILEYAADNQACKILICLNHCRLKLTQDAAGDRFDLLAQELKKEWLERLYSLQASSVLPTWIKQILLRCSIAVEFVELNGDKSLEESFERDERTRGIWTASSIGAWIAASVGESRLLHEHMAKFSYDEWKAGVQSERRKIREEQANQMINVYSSQ